ncbi:MAG: TrmH family RNA methyltransferase [Balneola sp.]|nr:MAG: TrmH family RNA methyltransferase [Balneola sp.]
MPKKLSTQQILEENLSQEAPPKMRTIKVVLHNIRSLHNVGSLFRSCDAFGVSELMLSGYTPHPPRPEISKTAIGAEEFVPWSVWGSFEELTDSLKKDGYVIIGLEQMDESISLPEFSPDNHDKLCLVMGNEVTGIDDDAIPFIDQFVSIPQFGKKHSLNVSVAGGVLLYSFLEKLWGN